LILAQGFEPGRIGDIGFEQANIGMHQQLAVTMRSSAGYADAPAKIRQRKSELRANKSAPTEK
jgi:hypothetical protein